MVKTACAILIILAYSAVSFAENYTVSNTVIIANTKAGIIELKSKKSDILSCSENSQLYLNGKPLIKVNNKINNTFELIKTYDKNDCTILVFASGMCGGSRCDGGSLFFLKVSNDGNVAISKGIDENNCSSPDYIHESNNIIEVKYSSRLEVNTYLYNISTTLTKHKKKKTLNHSEIECKDLYKAYTEIDWSINKSCDRPLYLFTYAVMPYMETLLSDKNIKKRFIKACKTTLKLQLLLNYEAFSNEVCNITAQKR